MQALTAGPAAAPRRQIIMGTTLGVVAMVMMVGGMLAVWSEQRTNFVERDGNWLPSGVVIPEVAANVALIAFIAICTFAQWAVWAAKRNDRGHGVFALSATALVAIMVINAQAFIYSEMGLGIGDGAYATMFYALTGLFMALMIIGVIFSVVAAFRFAGGRSDNEILAAHAIYWYAMSVIYTAIWFVVYVTK
jgi:heme/copper-type cytochrome/quinol oxidase subunit 3